VISFSSRDHGHDGFHGYYMAKDVLHPAIQTPLRSDHVLVCTDVDYYLNVPQWLRTGNPLLMYTFTPERVAGKVADGAFTIENDKVSYRVNGGGEYEHQVWDYSHDFVRVDYLTGSWFCSVESKRYGDQHHIVLVNPVRWVWTVLARIVPGEQIERRKFEVSPGVNRIDYLTDTGDVRTSLGQPGKFVSVDTTLEAYEAVRIRIASAKTPDVHTVEKYLNSTSAREDQEARRAVFDAPLLFAVVQADKTVGKKPYTIGGQPASYQCSGKAIDKFLASEEGRVIGREVAPPLTDNPAVVPRESWNNDLQCVRGRVEGVRNVAIPPQRYASLACEFVDLVVGEKRHTGLPITVDEVDQIQNRPTQRTRTEKVRQFVTDNASPVKISAFMKKEAYTGVNDPRNISQVPTTHTLALSSYTYAMKEALLKDADWYAPCKSPDEIAARISEIALLYAVLTETDFSRFDGTISEWLRRNVERAVYLRWAVPEEKSRLGSLLAAEYRAAGVTKMGVRYNAGYGRLSGSPLTTDGNTLINAFVSYAAARLSGESKERAYKKLGMYAGDDGVSVVPEEYMCQAAKDLGLTLKCVNVQRGKALNFLARRFPDPWTCMGSVQDPARTIKKLHISFAPQDVSDSEALFNRADGYLTLDPNAPITANWCRKVIQILGPEMRSRAEAVLERCKPDRPYYLSWPQIDDQQTAISTVADALGLEGSEVVAAMERIDAATTLSDLHNVVHTEDQDKAIGVRCGSVEPLPLSSSSSSPPPRRVKRQRKRKSDSGRGSSA
jgi:hypothetical protein